MIIGLTGLIGSGKGTVSDYLIETHNFKEFSFASSVKDCLSSIFGWDRDLLQGATLESRLWREEVDQWWANRLDIPNFTPRWAMQNIGTDLFREKFHSEIWVASLQRKILNHPNENVVVSDIRFKNEFFAMKDLGAIMVQVKRGTSPEWYEDACVVNTSTCNTDLWKQASLRLSKYDIHMSECSVVGLQSQYTIENNGSKEELFCNIEDIIKRIDHESKKV